MPVKQYEIPSNALTQQMILMFAVCRYTPNNNFTKVFLVNLIFNFILESQVK